MAVVIAEQELFRSCRILFGADKNITRGFLEYLQLSGIKTAYRKKALETHPDVLAQKNGKPPEQNGDLFRVVQQAYENLRGYLDAREQGFRFRVTPRPVYTAHARTASTKRNWGKAQAQSTQSRDYQWTSSKRKNTAQQKSSNSGHRAHKPSRNKQYSFSTAAANNYSIPPRRLLFGHYLYYSGIANWQTIIKAIVWQRTERPKIGELARKYGWLSGKDILTVLKRRKLSDSFGKSAVNLGMLTHTQLRILLFQQKKMQKKFGQYFIKKQLLTPFQLQRLVNQFYSHNTSVHHYQARSYRNRM